MTSVSIQCLQLASYLTTITENALAQHKQPEGNFHSNEHL